MDLDLDDLRIDPDVAENGKLIPFNKKIKFKIAQKGNKRYQQSYANLLAEMIKTKALDEMTDDDWIEVQIKAVAKGCLTGWEGLTAGGVEVPYTEDAAIELMLDETLPTVRDFIYQQASNQENFRLQNIELAKKKSEKLLSGN